MATIFLEKFIQSYERLIGLSGTIGSEEER